MDCTEAAGDFLTVNRGIDGRCVESSYMEKRDNPATRYPEATCLLRRPGAVWRQAMIASIDSARGLIGDLVPIEGSKQRGFTPAQAQRFLRSADVVQAAGTKRPRASALAFWLCWNGATDVPPGSRLRAIERRRRILGASYAAVRTKARSSAIAEDPERWRKAGIPWAKPFIKELLQSFIDSAIMLDILATIIGLVLRALFSQTSFEAAVLKRVAFLFEHKEVRSGRAREIWNVILRDCELFDIDERNERLLVRYAK